jgi:hypothetical protein
LTGIRFCRTDGLAWAASHFRTSEATAMLELWPTTSLQTPEEFRMISGGHRAAPDSLGFCEQPRRICFIVCSQRCDGDLNGGHHNGMPFGWRTLTVRRPSLGLWL